ncbi:MAG: hypothetical protein H7839_00920 [Magnetococcus sp. YQC-5]
MPNPFDPGPFDPFDPGPFQEITKIQYHPYCYGTTEVGHITVYLPEKDVKMFIRAETQPCQVCISYGIPFAPSETRSSWKWTDFAPYQASSYPHENTGADGYMHIIGAGGPVDVNRRGSVLGYPEDPNLRYEYVYSFDQYDVGTSIESSFYDPISGYQGWAIYHSYRDGRWHSYRDGEWFSIIEEGGLPYVWSGPGKAYIYNDVSLTTTYWRWGTIRIPVNVPVGMFLPEKWGPQPPPNGKIWKGFPPSWLRYQAKNPGKKLKLKVEQFDVLTDTWVPFPALVQSEHEADKEFKELFYQGHVFSDMPPTIQTAAVLDKADLYENLPQAGFHMFSPVIVKGPKLNSVGQPDMEDDYTKAIMQVLPSIFITEDFMLHHTEDYGIEALKDIFKGQRVRVSSPFRNNT